MCLSGMTLELALRRIGRDDIVPHCANVEGRESLLPGQYYETDIMKTSESVEELIHPEGKDTSLHHNHKFIILHILKIKAEIYFTFKTKMFLYKN